MNALTLPKSIELNLNPTDELEIQKIARMIYTVPGNWIERSRRKFVNTIDHLNNSLFVLPNKQSSNTVFWLSDNYEDRISYGKNKRIFRAPTLIDLIKNSDYLEQVSVYKPKYLILKVSGSDFLMPDRINCMLKKVNEGEITTSEAFDIVMIILKKTIQKLYYSVHMLSPDTKIICQEIRHPQKWVDQLQSLGIFDEVDRQSAVKQLLMAFCKVLRELADRYENFDYEGCRGS